MSEFAVLGRKVPMIDGAEKLAGQSQYYCDVRLPNMLCGKILRSPFPHARIIHINTDKAERLSGVKAVIAAADTPKIKSMVLGPPYEDKLPLTDEKVRYIGDEVAAVAAVDEGVALEALDLIEVEYEELPAVFDPIEAMEPGAPQIHEAEKNIAAHFLRNWGDAEEGFRLADDVFEDEFKTQPVAHCCLETHGTLAHFDTNGNLWVWTTTQASFWLRLELAHMLQMPISKVRVMETTVGGAYGGRSKVGDDEAICAFLARKAARPVKIVLSRQEEFAYTRIRHPMTIRIKTGVKEDGQLTAREVTIITDNGAYNNVGPSVTAYAGAVAGALYRVPRVRVEGLTVYTNKQFGGPFRGYGAPQMTFAIESQLDIIAKKMGLDRVEMRLKNANRPGDVMASGWKMTSCGMKECIEAVARAIGSPKKMTTNGKTRGVGFSALVHVSGAKVYQTIGGDFSSAVLKLTKDGRAALSVGNVDTGTWAKTALAQIAAEEIGLRFEDIRVIFMDTELTPLDLGSWASRSAFVAGNAVKKAANDARRKLFEAAARKLEARPEDLQCRDGLVSVKGAPKRSILVSEAVAEAGQSLLGDAIYGHGHYDPPCDFADRVTGYANFSAAYTFLAHGVEVEVDEETGELKIIKYAAAQDLGRVINPFAIENQMEGGIVQGVGFALSEELVYDNGRLINPTFIDYMVPRAADSPKAQLMMIETVDPEGPFGAKGAGEPGLAPVAAAIANALDDAVGVRIKELPITREKIFYSLRSKAE